MLCLLQPNEGRDIIRTPFVSKYRLFVFFNSKFDRSSYLKKLQILLNLSYIRRTYIDKAIRIKRSNILYKFLNKIVIKLEVKEVKR